MDILRGHIFLRKCVQDDLQNNNVESHMMEKYDFRVKNRNGKFSYKKDA